MKRVLVYATCKQGSQEGSSIEEALKNINEGHKVMYLLCGNKIGGCLENPLFNPIICRFCKMQSTLRAKKHLQNKCKIKNVDDYVSGDIISKSKSAKLEYTDLDSLRNLNYNGCDIGFGALSSYISLTRNMHPNLENNDIRNYLNDLLRQQILLISVLENIFKTYKPDLICFHNGRFAQYKPLLELSKKYGINYVCTETLLTSSGVAMKNNYYNTIPHSAIANVKRYKSFWDNYPDIHERESIAQSFFINRKYGIYSGDKIYIEHQVQGKMPDNWDSTKENIVIFNSSEDEFCAINSEVDSAKLYKDQITGIIDIVQHYENDTTKMFYLRIHPNLKEIPFSYHQDLYKLKFRNLHIIPADDNISTYSLMDNASKIIVFGSTTGIESVYWKKPVICLGFAFYSSLNVVYTPKNELELYQLIEEKKLPHKYSENVLKYGLYYMSTKHEKFKYVDNGLIRYKIGKRKWQWPRYAKTFGSPFINMCIEAIVRRISHHLLKLDKHQNIPV